MLTYADSVTASTPLWDVYKKSVASFFRQKTKANDFSSRCGASHGLLGNLRKIKRLISSLEPI